MPDETTTSAITGAPVATSTPAPVPVFTPEQLAAINALLRPSGTIVAPAKPTLIKHVENEVDKVEAWVKVHFFITGFAVASALWLGIGLLAAIKH